MTHDPRADNERLRPRGWSVYGAERSQPVATGGNGDPATEIAGLGESVWLEPSPEVLLEGVADRSQHPDARYETREAIGLAFVAGLQRLPPHHRAVLVLRDVLAFRASEVAEILDVTEVSVNRSLQRARKALETVVPPGQHEHAPLPGSREELELVDRFTTSW
jgi:DNA-directed RNA polymerase specialized sigma24 family protein